MRRTLLLLLIAACATAQTVTISARNWGPDSLQRDNAIATYFAQFADATGAEGDVSWLAQYEYATTDSSVSVYDMTQPDPRMMMRYFNPTMPEPTECSVSPVWAMVSKHSPAKIKYAKFSTWAGGPKHTGVGPLDAVGKTKLKNDIAKLRAAVNALENDGNDWKKNGKTLTKSKKRAACWRVTLKKDKASDYTKTKKSKGAAR